MTTPSSRRTHVVPTHLRTPQTLLTLAGVSITVRQFLLLLVGVALGYQVWSAFGWLALWPGGLVLRVMLTLIAGIIILALAFLQIAARPLEVWLMVLIRYALRPRRLVWRSVRWSDSGWSGDEEEKGGKQTN